MSLKNINQEERMILRRKLDTVEDRYPELSTLFGGYFHEDAEGSFEKIFSEQVFPDYTIENIKNTLLEIQPLREEFPNENELGRAIGGAMGGRHVPVTDPNQYTVFLKLVEEAFIKELENRTRKNE